MPRIDSRISPIALIPPDNGIQYSRVIGWTGTHVDARAARTGCVACKCVEVHDRMRCPIITHAGGIIRFVSHEEGVYDKRRAAEVIVHAATLLFANVPFEDAVEENGIGAQIIGHAASPAIGQVVFEGAIDKGGYRPIHPKRRWKDLCHHVVDATAFPGLVADEGAISNRWGNLVIEHAGAGPNIRAP